MTKVNIITANPLQTMVLRLENGQNLALYLRYSYNQKGWFYGFTYGSYVVNNKRIVQSANMLRGIRNIVPFGLACLLSDGYEPLFINDFINGRASLYTLSSSDVTLVENSL